jgi:hypothetical protein
MVTEVKLNEDQKRNLERQIEDVFTNEGLVTTGMEVHWVHQFNDGEYRVHYSYENSKNKVCKGDIYCRFSMNNSTVTDFVETPK